MVKINPSNSFNKEKNRRTGLQQPKSNTKSVNYGYRYMRMHRLICEPARKPYYRPDPEKQNCDIVNEDAPELHVLHAVQYQ